MASSMVDKASTKGRPVIEPAMRPPRAAQRHQPGSVSEVSPLQQLLHLALLIGLRLHPFAHELLFVAHVLDEALNTLSQARKRLALVGGGRARERAGARKRRLEIRSADVNRLRREAILKLGEESDFGLGPPADQESRE